jgi:hypothetical protein
MDEKRVDKIHWHTGFQGAVELEFRENRGDLKFDREHYLSKEPIRMDMLIIKVVKGAKIKNEIGHIFKEHNVIEYKGPDDSINIDDLFKTIGYACLYKGLEEKVDSIPADELTVSLLIEKKPVEFFKAVERIGGTFENKFPGIYYINGITLLDTQLVVFEELVGNNHSSLRLLSKTVDENDAKLFLERTADITIPGDRDNMNAVLEVSILANRELYQRLKKEEFGMCEALRDLMKDEIEEEMTKAVNEAVNEAVTENEKKNAVENEKKVVGFIEALMDSSHIDVDKAMEMLQIPAGDRVGLKQKIVSSN